MLLVTFLRFAFFFRDMLATLCFFLPQDLVCCDLRVHVGSAGVGWDIFLNLCCSQGESGNFALLLAESDSLCLDVARAHGLFFFFSLLLWSVVGWCSTSMVALDVVIPMWKRVWKNDQHGHEEQKKGQSSSWFDVIQNIFQIWLLVMDTWLRPLAYKTMVSSFSFRMTHASIEAAWFIRLCYQSWPMGMHLSTSYHLHLSLYIKVWQHLASLSETDFISTQDVFIGRREKVTWRWLL